MNNFRKSVLPKSTMSLARFSSEMLGAVALLDDHDQTNTSKEEYHIWIDMWKRMYHTLTMEIRILKEKNFDPEAQRILQYLKLVANTFLNMRQRAKNSRRARFDREDAEKALKNSTEFAVA